MSQPVPNSKYVPIMCLKTCNYNMSVYCRSSTGNSYVENWHKCVLF